MSGVVDRAACDAFVGRRPVPALRPGQVVVPDNLPVPKSPEARRLVEAAGCRAVFLPTDSPDRNPIEHAFATCTQALRRLAPRSFPAVVEAVGAALATVTPEDARACYRTAGNPA